MCSWSRCLTATRSPYACGPSIGSPKAWHLASHAVSSAGLGATLQSAQETERLTPSYEREEEKEKEIDADAVFRKLSSLRSAPKDEDEDDQF